VEMAKQATMAGRPDGTYVANLLWNKVGPPGFCGELAYVLHYNLSFSMEEGDPGLTCTDKGSQD
jgi:hypothetical protein